MSEAFVAPSGQLAAAKATLYTVPVGKTAVLLKVTAVNEDTTAAKTWNLYRHDGTASRRLIPVNANIPAGLGDVFSGPVSLLAGNLIEGDASAANDVDFTLTILEITP